MIQPLGHSAAECGYLTGSGADTGVLLGSVLASLCEHLSSDHISFGRNGELIFWTVGFTKKTSDTEQCISVLFPDNEFLTT